MAYAGLLTVLHAAFLAQVAAVALLLRRCCCGAAAVALVLRHC
jgi:hypothetical protein